jgi:hypothetical protein
MAGGATERPANCPRCGHDLRGPQAGWGDACPLGGRCSECGLDFAWGDVLSGRLHFPRWSTEDARGVVSWLGRVPRQLVVATFAWRRMLRQLRLEHAIRPVRLLSGLSLPVILLAMIVVLVTASGYVGRGIPWDRALGVVLSSAPTQAVVVTLPIPGPGQSMVAATAARGFTIVPRDPAWGAVPTVTEDVPADLGYLLLAAPLIEVLTADGRPVVLESTMGPISVAPPRPDGRRPSVPEAIAGGEARWYFPGALVTAARQLTGLTTMYPAPVTMLEDTLSDHLDLLAGVAAPIGFAVPVAFAGFAVLPIARRRARVRWAHLLRLTGLAVHTSLGLALVFLVLGPVAGLIGPGRPAVVDAVVETLGRALGIPGYDRDILLVLGGVFGLPILVSGVWWTWAAHHYLRMERAVLVGLSVAAVSWLGLIVVGGLVGSLLFA